MALVSRDLLAHAGGVERNRNLETGSSARVSARPAIIGGHWEYWNSWLPRDQIHGTSVFDRIRAALTYIYTNEYDENSVCSMSLARTPLGGSAATQLGSTMTCHDRILVTLLNVDPIRTNRKINCRDALTHAWNLVDSIQYRSVEEDNYQLPFGFYWISPRDEVEPQVPPSENPHPLNWTKLRERRPTNSLNQYQFWYTNIFEDHWGDHADVNYYDFLDQELSDAINNGGGCPDGFRAEGVTRIDSDPDFAEQPLDTLEATPVFCQNKIMVFAQYDPRILNPRAPMEPRPLSCRVALYRIQELVGAIKNKWNPTAQANSTVPGWKALPESPNTYANKVYNEKVAFKWENFDSVNVQIVGRTRWSEDRSEWFILGLLDRNDKSDQCPFRLQ
ncbi:hypothetical protein H072_2383 [Dactylellina haptotyla CBS 200.50]|uniref:Uncharacterized protein n=1 Tax=Dactylellina haptotyla (strain CBS 200.50) TaxID=1284197 RepID=S8C792_DACHA|nr:hypothetical protein H072_2383 [Dactylellina haptotyla CBS 200.50]